MDFATVIHNVIYKLFGKKSVADIVKDFTKMVVALERVQEAAVADINAGHEAIEKLTAQIDNSIDEMSKASKVKAKLAELLGE